MEFLKGHVRSSEKRAIALYWQTVNDQVQHSFGRIGAICGGRLNEIIHHLIVAQVTMGTASTGLDNLENRRRRAIGLATSLWGGSKFW